MYFLRIWYSSFSLLIFLCFDNFLLTQIFLPISFWLHCSFLDNSIIFSLLKLPEETLLYPAHDYNGEKVSSIGKEKKFNPRLQVSSENEYVEIMNNLNLPEPKMMDVNVARNIKLGA